MGRRKLLGICVVCGLTFLNIWMAKYVIKPLKEARQYEEAVRDKDRRLSDLLVISVEDVHPLQHLQEAALLNGKRETTSYSPRELHQTTQYRGLLAPGYNKNMRATYDEKSLPSHNSAASSQDLIYSPQSLDYNKIRTDNAHNTNDLGIRKVGTASSVNLVDMSREQLDLLDTGQLINIRRSLESFKDLLRQLSPSSRSSVINQLTTSQTVGPYEYGSHTETLAPSGYNVHIVQHDENIGHNEEAFNPNENSILDFVQNSIQPPQMAAPAMPQATNASLLNKLLYETNTDNLNRIINENPGAVLQLLMQILRQLKQRQQLVQSHSQDLQQQQQLVQSHSQDLQQQQQLVQSLSQDLQQQQQLVPSHSQNPQQKQLVPSYSQDLQQQPLVPSRSQFQEQRQIIQSQYQIPFQNHLPFISKKQPLDASSPRQTINNPSDPLEINKKILQQMVNNIANYNYLDKNSEDIKVVENFVQNFPKLHPAKPKQRVEFADRSDNGYQGNGIVGKHMVPLQGLHKLPENIRNLNMFSG